MQISSLDQSHVGLPRVGRISVRESAVFDLHKRRRYAVEFHLSSLVNEFVKVT